MFATAIRQLRVGLSIMRGKPLDVRNVERLIADALDTLETFGSAGEGSEQLLEGPFADADVRRGFQEQALRRTA